MTSDVYNIDCMEYMRTLPDKYFDKGNERFDRECLGITKRNGKTYQQTKLFE